MLLSSREVCYRPDWVDLLPTVIGIEDPGPKDREVFTREGLREMLPRHDLGDEPSIFVAVVVLVQESLVPRVGCHDDVVVPVGFVPHEQHGSSVGPTGPQDVESVGVVDALQRVRGAALRVVASAGGACLW